MCLNLNDYQIKFFSLNQVLHAKSLQLCPTLFDLMDSSLPGSSVLGILQKRILEWVAMPSSGGLPDPGPKTYPLFTFLVPPPSFGIQARDPLLVHFVHLTCFPNLPLKYLLNPASPIFIVVGLLHIISFG